jgi:iron complex outermembrane recepter protein
MFAMTVPGLVFADGPQGAPIASAAATPVPDSGSGLEEIIVTASRREENLQKESRAITALSAEDLQQNDVYNAQALNALVPGLSIANSGDQLQVYVRGIGDRTVTAQTDPGVAFNYNNIYLPRAWESTLTLFDTERLEVVKGPQGTLYGRNATAGALNVIPVAPSLDSTGGYVEAEGGNYKEHRFDGALNVPLNDWIAFRGSFQTVQHDGYLSDGSDDADSQAFRFQMLMKPNDDFSLKFSLDYTHNGGHGQGSVILPLVDPKNPWLSQANPITNAYLATSFLQPLPFLDNEFQNVNTWIASADIEWNLPGMTLTVIPGYVQGNEKTLTYAGSILTPEQTNSTQESLEVRLSSAGSGSALSWVVGAFGSHEDLSELDFTDEGAILGTFITDFPTLTDRTWAIFGESKYSVTDRLRLIAGARYTWEQKQADGSTTTNPADDFIYPTAASTFFSGRQDWSAVNWRAGAEFDVTPQSMAYFTASTGFKAGGFYAAQPPNTYEPEKLTAYELGIKNRFFDQRLQANIELFHWDVSDLQEQFIAPVNPAPGIGLVTKNAAKATLNGVDLSVSALVTPDDLFSVETEYNRAKYGDFQFDTVFLSATPETGCLVGPAVNPASGATGHLNCSGFQLVNAPLWSGAASYQHTFHLPDSSSLVFNVSEHFSSSYWLATDFTPQEHAPAYALTDAILTYNLTGSRVKFSAFVRNIENKPVYDYAVQNNYVPGIASVDIGPPRTYGLRVRYTF